MLELDYHFRSDIGRKRSNNEDSSAANHPEDTGQLAQSGSLFVVADGLGGHQEGEYASSHATQKLIKEYYRRNQIHPVQRLKDIISEINRDLVQYAQKSKPGMKVATTLVAALIWDNNLVVANVGDSRAYLLRGGHLRQISQDHSMVGELVRSGAMSEAEAQQSKLRNRLTRSLGGQSDVEVDFFPPMALSAGDVILLCSDGLTQYADNEYLTTALQRGNAREIGERLIQFANDSGGSDNISVVVVKVGDSEASTVVQKVFKPKESRDPRSNVLRFLAAFAIGVISLAALTVIGGIGLEIIRDNSPTSTPTLFLPTVTLGPAVMESPISQSTASMPPVYTDTPQPSPIEPTETATPEIQAMDCEYVVQTGDTAGEIADKFSASLEQVTKPDDETNDLNTIFPGDILIISDITPEVCEAGGGTPKEKPVAPGDGN